MENKWVTLETILLFFAILISWVLNGLAVFMKYWYFQDGFHYGIVPVHFQDEYGIPMQTFMIASGIMMLIAFCLFVLLAGFYAFALISYFIHKYKATRIGYLLVAIISCVDAFLQLASFIVMTVCLQFPDYYRTDFLTTIGACEYLAIISCIFNILIIPIAIHLWRTDLDDKATSATSQWGGTDN